jgi:hypothetical protein
MAKRLQPDAKGAPPCATRFGLPLDYAAFRHELSEENTASPKSGGCREELFVRDFESRILHVVDTLRAAREHYYDRGIRYFNHDQDWGNLDFDWIRDSFTTDELNRLLAMSVVTNCVTEQFENDPLYSPLAKVRNSMWQWGQKVKWAGPATNYAALCRLYRGFAKFDFGVPGFETYYDTTDCAWGSEGWSKYTRNDVLHHNGQVYPDRPQWLDGHFAFQIVQDGQHRLTIGFALSGSGVLVTQIQIRGKKKGNRWLFKLSRPLREYVIDRMRAAWPGVPVAIITGESQKKYGQYCHRRTPADYPDPIADRVAGFYEAPLAGYQRGEVITASPGYGPRREFQVLTPVDVTTPSPARRAAPELAAC